MVFNKLLQPIFSSFSKKKWLSRNPSVRKKAVQELPVSDQQVLSDIALNDSEADIRAIAVNKLSDLDLLQTIIMKGTNEAVKQVAQTRLFQLLCGLKHPVPEFDIREKMVRGSRNSELLEYIAEHAKEAPLRELTIKKLSRDPLLGNIALNDNNAQIRQLAAQQIAKRSTLERVAKNSRRKDKRVYKIIKDKLDRIIDDEERPARLAKEVVEICDKLEKLHKRNLLLQEKTTFDNYTARWNEIKNFADQTISDRFASVCTKINTQLAQLEQAHQKEQAAIQTLEILLNNLSNTVDDLLNAKEAETIDHEKITSQEKIIANLKQEWHENIKHINNAKALKAYNTKFQAILELAENKPEKQESNHTNSLEKITNLTNQAEAMLEKSGFILEKTIAVLQDKFKQQITNFDSLPEELHTVQEKFNQTISALKEQLSEQQQKAHTFKQETESTIEKINLLIADGYISKAEKQLHNTLKRIEQSLLISNSDKQYYQNKLRQLQQQLGNLSSWRNWAHDNERENLAQKAEQLAEQAKQAEHLEKDYLDITSAIKELRQQWKKMHSHTPEELWQRFNGACNLTYEYCTPFIDKEIENRNKNLLAKQALCQQLEDYINTMGWPSDKEASIDQSIDWIQVDKITKQARKEWSNIGFVERKEHKKVTQRFNKAIECIRSELKKAWQFNQEQFFELIQKAEQLAELMDEDLNNAINKSKDYQKQWKTIGPVSPYQRAKLWKRFRNACDIVFNKRQETIEHKNNTNIEKLREKQAICENLEALNQQPLSINDLENAFLDIKTLWHELEPQAKSLSTEVNKRYQLAVDNYYTKIASLTAQKEEHTLALVRQKSALCTQIERTDSLEEQTLKNFQEQWQLLDEQSDAKSYLGTRFTQAVSAINTDKSELIALEIQAKEAFCLENEILLGKNSPEEFQQARMEKQVELLNSNLGNNGDVNSNTQGNKSAYQLQLDWHELSNYTQSDALEQRFINLISS